MNIRNEIEKYVPYNEQETKDKELILKCIDTFDDVLTRNNEIVHFTCSGFVLNETRDKVLMVYHNIYNSWSWTGGHADGELDFLSVARREVEEETGIKEIKALSNNIISVDMLTVFGHIKRGKYVSSHMHISVAYLFEAKESELIHIKEDENSNVGWLALDTFLDSVTEEHMKPIYIKIINKVKEMKYI